MRAATLALLLVGLGVSGCATIGKPAPTPAQSADKAWIGEMVVAETLDGLTIARVLHGRDAAKAYDTLVMTAAAFTASDDARLARGPPDPLDPKVAADRVMALAAASHAELDLMSAAQR